MKDKKSVQNDSKYENRQWINEIRSSSEKKNICSERGTKTTQEEKKGIGIRNKNKGCTETGKRK